LVGLRNTKISFPAWSDYGIPKFHSPLGRITEYQNFIPRLVELRIHSPLGRITEYQNFIPRFVGLRKEKKRHSPVYRITESKKKRLPLLYRITEYQTSVFLRFVGLRKLTQVLFS